MQHQLYISLKSVHFPIWETCRRTAFPDTKARAESSESISDHWSKSTWSPVPATVSCSSYTSSTIDEAFLNDLNLRDIAHYIQVFFIIVPIKSITPNLLHLFQGNKARGRGDRTKEPKESDQQICRTSFAGSETECQSKLERSRGKLERSFCYSLSHFVNDWRDFSSILIQLHDSINNEKVPKEISFRIFTRNRHAPRTYYDSIAGRKKQNWKENSETFFIYSIKCTFFFSL